MYRLISHTTQTYTPQHFLHYVCLTHNEKSIRHMMYNASPIAMQFFVEWGFHKLFKIPHCCSIITRRTEHQFGFILFRFTNFLQFHFDFPDRWLIESLQSLVQDCHVVGRNHICSNTDTPMMFHP